MVCTIQRALDVHLKQPDDKPTTTQTFNALMLFPVDIANHSLAGDMLRPLISGDHARLLTWPVDE